MLGSALHVFQYARCGRTPLACCWCRSARTSKQELMIVRGACTSNTLPRLAAAARGQSGLHCQVWRRLTGSVTFLSGPEIEASCGFVCDVSFRPLVKLIIFLQLSVKPRRLVTDICYRSSKHVVFSFQLGQVQNSSPGLTPSQLIPSELLGRAVGGLHWHVVGVEPPKQVSQELVDVRDEGTSNTLPGFVTTARFPNHEIPEPTIGNADVKLGRDPTISGRVLCGIAQFGMLWSLRDCSARNVLIGCAFSVHLVVQRFRHHL